MKHFTFDYGAINLAGVDSASQFLEPIFTDRDREMLLVAMVDDDVGLIEMASFPGTEVDVGIHLRPLLERAMKIDCAGLILAHNHPSGDERPSDQDCRFTKQLVELARALDIMVIDHLIFAEGQPFSFRRRRMI